jgi:hypothetical protein
VTKRADALVVGDEIANLGTVERVAVHSKDYRAPIRSKVGKKPDPKGMRGVVCPPFKPTPVVEVRIEGREAPEFFWPKQKVELAP